MKWFGRERKSYVKSNNVENESLDGVCQLNSIVIRLIDACKKKTLLMTEMGFVQYAMQRIFKKNVAKSLTCESRSI